MGVTLAKGGNVSLSKAAPNLTQVLIGLGWDARSTTGADFDLDASALLCSGGRVMGDGEQITYPSRSTRLDYEAEVAVVIGKRGKDIQVDEAPAYIWGVTLFNDWTDRDAVRPLKLPLSFNLGKNFDCSTSLGPCICVRGGVTPQDTAVALTVNGEVRQSFRTSEMMFSFAEFIAGLSRDFTLLPGDIIAGGTGAGTAMDSSKYDSNRRSLPDLFLKVGDEVEVSSPLIGVLRNRIVSKS